VKRERDRYRDRMRPHPPSLSPSAFLTLRREKVLNCNATERRMSEREEFEKKILTLNAGKAKAQT